MALKIIFQLQFGSKHLLADFDEACNMPQLSRVVEMLYYVTAKLLRMGAKVPSSTLVSLSSYGQQSPVSHLGLLQFRGTSQDTNLP